MTKFKDYNDSKKQRFFSLYKETKLKEEKIIFAFKRKNIRKFIKSRSGSTSIGISMGIFLIECIIYFNNGTNSVNDLKPVIEIIIGGQIGLLGFIIAGVTLLLSSINNDILDIVDSKNLAHDMMSLFFSFYYVAALVGLDIVIMIVSYLLILVDIPENFFVFIFLSLSGTFITIYSLVYSITLIGTCIRITLLKHFYLDNFNCDGTTKKK